MSPDRTPSAVFLHTGWRSCGTWIWSRFRENPHVRAYYEPLHEGLASITQADIGRFRPNSWNSGHASTAAYFAEYGPLLNQGGGGVAGYRKRFAFDDFFQGEDADNPALEAYLRHLIDAAHAEGRLPVLKFCRSLGRVAWLQRRFPEAVHVTVLRDPAAQWHSARQQFLQDGNRYFILAPFVILARNAAHPLVAEALGQLDVTLPPSLGSSLAVAIDTAWCHVRRLDWAERYRGFLACWIASSVAALRSEAIVIDARALSEDEGSRAPTAERLATATGIDISLDPDPRFARRAAPAIDAANSLANQDARRMAAAHRDALPPPTAALLFRMLGGDASGQAPIPARVPPPHRRVVHTPTFQMIDAAIYIALKRASYPLRRLHGTIDRALPARYRRHQPGDHPWPNQN